MCIHTHACVYFISMCMQPDACFFFLNNNTTTFPPDDPWREAFASTLRRRLAKIIWIIACLLSAKAHNEQPTKRSHGIVMTLNGPQWSLIVPPMDITPRKTSPGDIPTSSKPRGTLPEASRIAPGRDPISAGCTSLRCATMSWCSPPRSTCGALGSQGPGLRVLGLLGVGLLGLGLCFLFFVFVLDLDAL